MENRNTSCRRCRERIKGGGTGARGGGWLGRAVHVLGVIWLSGWLPDLLWCTVHDTDLDDWLLIKTALSSAPPTPLPSTPLPTQRVPMGWKTSSCVHLLPSSSQVEWEDWGELEVEQKGSRVKPDIFACLPILQSFQLASGGPAADYRTWPRPGLRR